MQGPSAFHSGTSGPAFFGCFNVASESVQLLLSGIDRRAPTTPQRAQIASNRDHEALNRATLGGLEKQFGTDL